MKMKGHWRFIALFGIAVWLGACSSQGWQRLSDTEIRRLLPDYALLTASLDYLHYPDSTRQRAYDSFFAEHGYTTADWDSSVAWYARHQVNLLSDIYHQVNDSLTRQRDTLQVVLQKWQDQQEYAKAKAGYMLDSVNLLNIGECIYRSGELINQSVRFSPNEPYSNVELELSTQIFGLRRLVPKDALHMDLYLTLADTTISERYTVDSDGVHKLRLQVPEDKLVRHVRVLLRGALPDTLSRFIWLDSLRLIRYPLGDVQMSQETAKPLDATDNQAWFESEEL